MFTINLKMTGVAFPDEDAWARVRSRFVAEAGKRVAVAVQGVLGTSEIYTLSPGYRERKLKSGKMKRYPGKADDQPLILTGEMYEGVEFKRTGNEFGGRSDFAVSIAVDPSKGLNPRGFDYAEEMERRSQFLEAGLAVVVDELPELLEDIIVEELML